VQDLALEVREIDCIEINESDPADASGGKIESNWRSESARTDTENARRLDSLLPLEGDLGHDEMTRIARDLIVAQFDSRGTQRINDAFNHKTATIDNPSLSMIQGKEAYP